MSARPNGLAPLTGQDIALLYTRVSTDEQADEGVSLAAQDRDGRDYITRNPTWVFGGAFQDVLTGRRADRADYQRIKDTTRSLAAAGHRVKVVIARVDRLGRDVEELARAKRELETVGAEIHSTREGGRIEPLLYDLSALIAANESRVLGERVRKSFREIRLAGWHKPGRPAWGYCFRDATDEDRRNGSPLKILEPDPIEAPYVREAWARLANGDSLRSIVRWARGLPTDARGGRNLSYASVRKMFRSAVYVARVAHKGDDPDEDVLEKPAGRWDALVDDATWTAVAAALDRAGRLPMQASGDYLLTGLLRCDRCGSRMSGRIGRQTYQAKDGRARRYAHRSYVCSTRSSGAWSADTGCRAVVPADKVEHAIMETVTEMLDVVDSPGMRTRAKDALEIRGRRRHGDDDGQRLLALDAEMAKARGLLTEATRRVLAGAIPQLAYDLVREDLMREIAAAEEEQARLRGRRKTAPALTINAVLASVGGWARLFRERGVREQRLMLDGLLTRLEPLRLGHGRYEIQGLSWTPLGQAVLDIALERRPSENLVVVDSLAQTKRSTTTKI